MFWNQGMQQFLLFWGVIVLSRTVFGMDANEIKNELQEVASNSDNVEQFLGVLSKKFPEHFTYYTSAYASRSLHQSSLEFPRIILTGKSFSEANRSNKKAGFIMAFGTMPSDPRFQNVEVILWDPMRKNYEFIGIDFQDLGKAIADKGSLKTEAFCESCHGYPAKPIWDSYFFWPGIYGSEDDITTFRPYDIHPEYSSSVEFQNFQKFQDKIAEARTAKKGRLQFLKPLQKDQRPNLGLNRMAVRQSAELLTQEISKNLDVQKLKFLIWGAMVRPNGCENSFADYFPEDLRAEVRSTITKIKRELLRADQASLRARHSRYIKATGEKPMARAQDHFKPSEFYHESWAMLRFVLEGMVDEPYDLLEWGTEHSPKSYRITTINLLQKPFAQKLGVEGLTHSQVCDLGVQKHRNLNGNSQGFSSEYIKQVRRAINRFKPSNTSQELEVFKSCIGCHAPTNESGVPYIPFSNREFLKRRLIESARFGEELHFRISAEAVGTEKQMPPATPLSDSQRDRILEYLNSHSFQNHQKLRLGYGQR